MIGLLLRLIHRIVRRAERESFMHRIATLNREGHDIDTGAIFGPRLEVHAAPDSLITIERGVEILHDSWIITHEGNRLTLRENVFISQHCTISGNVEIGKNTLLGGFISVIDANHNFDRSDLPIRDQGGSNAPVVIGEDVWIGASSVILGGVTIGDHSIIGANSTVTGDIPPWSVAVGSPARVVKIREH